jgi:hypothetical protein
VFRVVSVVERRNRLPEYRPRVVSTVEGEYRDGLYAVFAPVLPPPPNTEHHVCYILLLDADDRQVAKVSEIEWPS